ncbi:hypothetical protein K431DRAFT_236623 [Polychaeton citri CBS 116435]|uniref:PEBP-like protein n=1 Tax=Polychaeton citri CBS 116435 TaxID=1314669 RepID=A0A9P4UJN0_9PEZI|nr:hypothetical protein K431DRAFT_236623 [Polychaeton citri CBS 116435]
MFRTAIATSVFAAIAYAQTPPGTEPLTNNTVNVQYGFGQITTDTLYPISSVSSAPVVSLGSQVTGTHLIALVDLSIPISLLPYKTDLAPGLGEGRSTRLHWLQTDLSQTANGSFYSTSAPLAFYTGPMPPPGDIAHTYTFYLFPQPANFSLPPADAGRNFSALEAFDRFNFSVTAISDVLGPPIAANYYRVQNTSSTTSPTPSGTGSGGAVPTFTGAATRAVVEVGGVVALLAGLWATLM